MHKHTRATPAGVPRGGSKMTRNERRGGMIRGGFHRKMRWAELYLCANGWTRGHKGFHTEAFDPQIDVDIVEA